jgi:hypothetical protein
MVKEHYFFIIDEIWGLCKGNLLVALLCRWHSCVFNLVNTLADTYGEL